MTKILQLVQPSFSGISSGSATELLGIQQVLPCNYYLGFRLLLMLKLGGYDIFCNGELEFGFQGHEIFEWCF